MKKNIGNGMSPGKELKAGKEKTGVKEENKCSIQN